MAGLNKVILCSEKIKGKNLGQNPMITLKFFNERF